MSQFAATAQPPPGNMPAKRQPGHRQKGAGTVVVSRGEQVRQGLTLKEWQRTPMQLLQQYCQSKKRINARYVHARAPEGRFRMRCILPDDKSSVKDLAFCPEQDFDTMDDAKHCAALLALRHVEPLRPLERQLPEPYDKLWLALVKEIAPSTGAAASTADKKQPASKKVAKKEEAKPAAKAIEKTEDTQAKPADEGIDLWGGVAAMEEEEAEDKKKVKAMPMELTSDRKFASRAEMQQAQLERAQQRNDRQRARENRERANPYKQVFMSAACREMIEGVLKELGVVGASAQNGAADESTIAEDHEELYAKVTKELRANGFKQKHIEGAIQACRKESSHSDDEYLTIILDWLCLNVPEGELPKGFNPEGTQLDVVVSSSNAKKPTSPLASVLVQRLMKFGYDRLDAASIANSFVEANSGKDLDANADTASDVVVMRGLQSAMQHLVKYLNVESSSASPSTQEDRQQVCDDELLVLESIYDDKLTRHELANGSQRLVLQLCDDSVVLDVYLPHDSSYPFEFPVIGVSAAPDASYAPQLLLHATGQALRSAATSLGEPMVYELCVAIETALMEAKKPVERIVLLDHTASKQASGAPSPSAKSVLPPPAPTPVKKSNGAPRKQNHKSQSKPQISSAQIEKLSADLLQRRRAKDSQKDFQSMLQARSRLPAGKEKENVLQVLQSNQVVLICGATGCGKTTQIPQFILDEFIDSGRGGACNIVCTQPRRLAAVGVATRVAQERCEKIADVVGYQIRMDAQRSAATRLLFCTTGVLLRRLLTDQSLTGVSHVIVDEVHERNVDTDFLLSILRDLLPKRRDLKVVLMSATMNAQIFVEYFASAVSTRSCPVLEIPGFTFPVETNFLEDVVDTTGYQIPKHLLKKKSKDEDENQRKLADLTTTELVALVDDSRIDYDLCVHVVQHLVSSPSSKSSGAILVFLPGTAEIKRLLEMLQSALGQRVWVLPLHGSLSGQDQSLVFQSPPKGKTKVILSTNVAETSITIDDVTAVIDTGRVKEMAYDPMRKRSELVDGWASRAACDQRRGRAGRVQAGTCFRLFSRHRFEHKMEAQLSAEIHRVSLEQLCLQIKQLGLGSIRGFLAKAIEPPNAPAIDAAIEELIAIAAFKPVGEDDDDSASSAARKKAQTEEEVRLTPLGSHLATLPLDARIGKFLIFGSILRCVEPVAAIAACIASKSPFVMSMNDAELRAKQEALKKELDGGSKSDHLVLARLVVDKYAPLKGQKMKRGYCREYGLSYETLESILELKTQYLQQLDAVGFFDPSQREELNTNAAAPRVVKAALCAGLYANVAQVVYPGQKYVQSAHGALTEDPNAKQIRYFIRTPEPVAQHPQERVFLHPSSVNFSQSQYDSPWLLYTELVQTSKLFARESSMVSPYALLLFGGRLSVVHDKNQLVLDDWIRFHAVARIGVLIKAMRRQLDLLLAQKLATPTLAVNHSPLVAAITTLLTTEGM